MNKTFTAVIHREEDMYVALCPELDVASQGETVQSARAGAVVCVHHPVLYWT